MNKTLVEQALGLLPQNFTLRELLSKYYDVFVKHQLAAKGFIAKNNESELKP